MRKIEIELTEAEIGEVLGGGQYCFKEWEVEKLKVPRDSFSITSVSREDLEGIGYDTSKIEDGTMEHLASKMADAYCDNGFWIDLPILADYLEIPKKEGLCEGCGEPLLENQSVGGDRHSTCI